MTTRFDPRTAPQPWPPAPQTALAVGLTRDELSAWSGARVGPAAMSFVEFSGLVRALSNLRQSDWVVTPLLSDGFDALDVAHLLAKLRFQGVLHVLIPPLPRPDVIRQELLQICREFTVELSPKPRH